MEVDYTDRATELERQTGHWRTIMQYGGLLIPLWCLQHPEWLVILTPLFLLANHLVYQRIERIARSLRNPYAKFLETEGAKQKSDPHATNSAEGPNNDPYFNRRTEVD